MSWSDWNSSTDLRSQLVSAQVEDSIQDEFLDFSSIMSAMKGNNLPEIIPVNLEFDGLLGNGSNFNVNRSILRGEGQTSYFVAVKHLRVEDRSRDHIQSLYKGLMREIRVLTHPSTRDHDNIVPLLAWGWTDQPLSGLRRPFLVMEYSDFGSLRNYLDGRRLPKAQRHTLALNVASGLQALHSSKIIHGDIKLENVLVYDAGNDHPRIAKLADFGSALFEHSWTDGSEYYGTRKYNAPEVEGRSGKQVQQKINGQISIGSCYKADVYSLGLCVWEVMAHGQDFIDVAWVLDHPDRGSFLQEEGILLRPETTTPKGIKAQLEYLDKVCETEADGMLTRALSYCRNMASFRDRDKEIIDSVDESLRSTLKDDARERSGINEVVKSLAKGTDKPFANASYPRVKISPSGETGSTASSRTASLTLPQILVRTKPESHEFQIKPGYPVYRTWQKASFNCDEVSVLKNIPTTSECTELAVFKKPPPVDPSYWEITNLDIMQLSGSSPPWKVQCVIVHQLTEKAQSTNLITSSEAYFQLSICSYLGFGMEPNHDAFFSHLVRASSGSKVARSIYKQIFLALKEFEPLDPEIASEADRWIDKSLLPSPRDSFATRIRIYQRYYSKTNAKQICGYGGRESTLEDATFLELLLHADEANMVRIDLIDGDGRHSLELLLVRVAELGSLSTVKHLIENRSYGNKDLSRALTGACKYGHLETAIWLISQCGEFVEDGGNPSPLHWLVMFDRIESEELATSLILGTSKDLDSSNGLCRSQINYVPTSGIGVAYFPEHCLELYGTPLHWAVRTRNLELVRLLVRLGADVHQFAFPSPPSDIGFSRLANLTPLGLAIVFHLPEITDFLIGHTYGKSKDRLQPDASMFTLLGRSCLPLSRYIIHGAEHRRALKQTIKSLVKHDACLEMVVRIGETSLMTEIFMESLAVTDQESYIPDELLFAGARVDGYTGNGDNAATVAVHDCALRRYSNTALRFVSAGGIDINMKNKHGYNALHYCSIHGSDGIMDAILRREDIDIDCTSTKGGYSALHLAAMFGSAEVIPVLIQGKATLELQNGAGYTALQTAVQNRRLAAAVALLRAGAETTFSNGESILHIAIKSTNRDTMIPQLLESYEELQHSKFTRAADKYGFCPLHTAAYVGDREGVRALLNHGARHNIFAKYRGPAKAKIPMRITALKMVEDVLSGERPGALLFGHFDSQKEPISNSYANPGHTGMQRRDKVAVRQYIADLQDIQQQLSRAAK